MFEGSHGSSAMEWLGSALSPVSPERSDVPYGYGAGRPSFLVKEKRKHVDCGAVTHANNCSVTVHTWYIYIYNYI